MEFRKKLSIWNKKFLYLAKKHPEAYESLELLRQGGMDTATILSLLFEYSHPDSSRNKKNERKLAKTISSSLNKARLILEKTAESIELRKSELSSVGFLLEPSEDLIAQQIRAWAREIGDASFVYGDVPTLKGKNRAEEVLTFLCLLVKSKTGTEHWGDLSYLLQVARELVGEQEEWDPDKLRKVFEHFREREPSSFKLLELLAKRSPVVETKKPQHRKPKKRHFPESKESSSSEPFNVVDHTHNVFKSHSGAE